MIGILDINTGNIKSIYNMLIHLDCEPLIINNLDKLKKVNKIIIPGVGAFDEVSANINKFKDILTYKVYNEKVPVLGICIGMQIFCSKSEEGKLNGLGWFDIKVKKFKTPKIPHIGFRWIKNRKFYFIHSYYVPINKFTVEALEYEGEKFSAIVKKDNILGVQFHPEKSHKYGQEFFKEFVNV